MKETRTGNRGDNAPRLKPVSKIELSTKHQRLRLILAAVFLVVGASFLAYSVSLLSAKDPGWYEIEVSSSEYNCGNDFVFQYHLGEGTMSATTEYKTLTTLYSKATEYAFQMFSNDVEYEGVHNMYYINRHLNEEIEVDDILYQAFSLIQRFGDRSLYLAPIYEQYNGLFYCTEEYQAREFDPYLNQNVADYYAAIANFANDVQMVNIELLGENRICLKVSEAYLSFAQENEIEHFVDFYWMKNAFIADYLADLMLSNGFTNGYIASFDGFFRNLDPSGVSYSFSLYDRADAGLLCVGTAACKNMMGQVFLRNYPLTTQDAQYHYQLENGDIRYAYLDAADGLCKSAVNGMIAYGENAGCAEILMRLIPVYIRDSLDPAAVNAMAEEGIYAVYIRDSVICYNDDTLTIDNVNSDYSLGYQPAVNG